MPEVNLTLEQYVRIVRRWWRTAVAIISFVLLLTAVFTLTSDDVYTTRATLLPQLDPDQQGVISPIPAQLGALGGMLPGMASPADVVISLLKSRTVAEGVVNSLDLASAWGIEGAPDRTLKRAVSKLQKRTKVVMDEHGLIRVQVQDTDRERVADIVNAYMEELDRTNRRISISSAAYTREFIDNRLEETRQKLLDVQARLQAFQLEHGAMDIEEQIKTTVEVIATLQGQLEALRARRDALMQFRSSRSAEINALDGEIKALEMRVKALSAGTNEDSTGVTRAEGVLLPLGAVPALSAEYTRMKYALEIQAEVYSMLSQQYEQAKIDEARNLPTIQVLDSGVAPLYRTRPRPKLYLTMGFILGAGLAALVILALDRLVPEEGSEGERWQVLVRRYPAAWAS